jgi:hypothetical protein
VTRRPWASWYMSWGALAGAIGQEPATHQLEALRLQIEELHRHLDAARQPARQMFFLGTHLDRVARLGHINAVRQRGAAHPALRRPFRQGSRLCGGQGRLPRLLPLPHPTATGQRARQQQSGHSGGLGPARPTRRLPGHGAQALRHGLIEHLRKVSAQGVAVGCPLAHPGRALGVRLQPGLHFGRSRVVQFAIEPGAQAFV